MLPLFAFTFAATMLFMTLVWLLSVQLHDASIVDIFWGAGFVYLAVVYFFFTEGLPARKLLLVALAAVWGARLSFHIFRRNRGKGEDPRYRAWRRAYGPERYWWVSFFQVYLLQGALMWSISLPLYAAQAYAQPLGAWDALGVLIWGVGLAFEVVGDWQLARFKANPANKGKVLHSGLWAYSRHPNYFGDSLVWWGFYLVAVAAGGWWTIFSPALMTLLLTQVSGVAMLEKSLEQRPEYREYIQTTSAFIPWFPKRPQKP